MICCWLSADEAQVLRDLIGPRPGLLAPVAEQLDASAIERQRPCEKPAAAIWLSKALTGFDFECVEEIGDLTWAKQVVMAIKSAHKSYITTAVGRM